MSTTSSYARRRSDHLPRSSNEPPRRPLLGLLSALGALALLLGVPVALVALVGNPLPTSPPTSDWLTTQVTPSLIINVLAVLLWVVWAQFVVCFLTEWRAIRSGSVPRRLAIGGGGPQLLARQLVAGILLLSGAATLAGGFASNGQTAHDAASAHTTTTTYSAPVAVDLSPDQLHADAMSAGGRSESADATMPVVTRKLTSVKPPQGRNHDTLWDIAERTLGDPLRYREIFELNKDRVMPDGRRFRDADLIHPGWQLVLPGDASGADVEALLDLAPKVSPAKQTPSRLPGIPATERAVAPSGSALGQVTSAVTSAAATSVGTTSFGTTTTGANVGQTSSTTGLQEGLADSGVANLLLGGGLILAGIARAMSIRRGPFGEPDPLDLEIAAAADARRADFVEQALQCLALQRRSQDRPMPELRFVYVDAEQLIVHLAAKLGQPEAPWSGSADGLAWTLRAEDLPELRERIPAPYPSLVSIAQSHGFDVLIDLEAAPGLISIAGDLGVARDLATAIALDLTTHQWADGVRVYMVGFGEHFVDLGSDRARTAASLDEVLQMVSTELIEQNAVLSRLGLQGVLQGRQGGAARACDPVVAIMSGPPTSEQAQQLSALTNTGRTSLSAICVGDSLAARWRFSVAADGTFEATALGLTGVARRQDMAAQRLLRDLLASSRLRRDEGRQRLESTPTSQLSTQLAHVGAADLPDWDSAAVKVSLLGPVTVHTPNSVDDSRRELLTEVVVMAALHPQGLHEAVLRANVWPRGVEDIVVRSRIGEVAAWLGSAADGEPRLRRDSEGRLHLSADVACDYFALTSAAAESGPVSETAELKALLLVLRTGQGEVFSGVGRHFHWMAFAREARQCRLLVAGLSRRAAELAAHVGQVEDAREALELGLAMVPTAEVLWREQLRLQAAHSPKSLPNTIDKLYSALSLHGVEQEPETAALVAELLPQRGWPDRDLVAQG